MIRSTLSEIWASPSALLLPGYFNYWRGGCRHDSKWALQEGFRSVTNILRGIKRRKTLIKADILAKTIIAEEAVVRKAGGKFKMNPLFPSTVAKIKTVITFPPPPSNTNPTNKNKDARKGSACSGWCLDKCRNRVDKRESTSSLPLFSWLSFRIGS